MDPIPSNQMTNTNIDNKANTASQGIAHGKGLSKEECAAAIQLSRSDPIRLDRVIAHLGDSITLMPENNPLPLHIKYAQQFEQVKQILLETNMFSQVLINTEAEEYYTKLGLNEYYFQTSVPALIASNLQCVIAAKVLNGVSKSDLFPLIQQETSEEVFWMSRTSLFSTENYTVEKQLEKRYLSIQPVPWRLQCYRSTGTIFHLPLSDDNERLRTYFLQTPEWPSQNVSPNETDFSKVADSLFVLNKRDTATERIYRELNQLAATDNTGLHLYHKVEGRSDGHRVDFAYRRSPLNETFFSTFERLLHIWGLFSHRKYVEPFANGVTIVTAFVDSFVESSLKKISPLLVSQTVEKRVARFIKAVHMNYLMPSNLFSASLPLEGVLSVHECAFISCATKFALQFSTSIGVSFTQIQNILESSQKMSTQDIYNIKSRLKQPLFSEESTFAIVKKFPLIVKELYQLFQKLFHPTARKEADKLEKGEEKLDQSNVFGPILHAIDRLDDLEAISLFKFCVSFVKHIKKTNFWNEKKLCLCFNMSPLFLMETDYNEKPYGVMMMFGKFFLGFHVRFQEIARGGIRVVQSFSTQSYLTNRSRIFDECYNLARTQNLKNKDIPEGGSKGVVLLNWTPTPQEAALYTNIAFKQYIDGILDIILVASPVSRHLTAPNVAAPSGDQEDIMIFCGPDENTGNLMDWACEHSRRRGLWFHKAFTTGKSLALGGIPHDLFGMTTTSVEEYVHNVLLKLNITDETKATKILIGGPDGDLGSNSLLMSDMKTIAIVDGSGVIVDPEGLNKQELKRLCHLRFQKKPTTCQMYDEKLLSKNGYKISIMDNDVTLPSGEVIANGRQYRDQFHILNNLTCDIFHPCGGRPESINMMNVEKFLRGTGEGDTAGRVKAVVEGGNLFCTTDARVYLAKHNVIVFKDASTNKGGVLSSSLEVLCALALKEDEHKLYMALSPGEGKEEKSFLQRASDFYKSYINSILYKIKLNAKLEFDVLWSDYLKTKKPICELTDTLSSKINELNISIQNSSLFDDIELRKLVLTHYIPAVLLPGVVSIEQLCQRVPNSYLKSLFACVLSTRFYYKFGILASQFDFFDFIQNVKYQNILDIDEEKIRPLVLRGVDQNQLIYQIDRGI